MPLAIPITALLPELILLIAGCTVLLLGLATRDPWRRLGPWVTLGGLVVALALAWFEPSIRTGAPAGSGLFFGGVSAFVRLAALELGIVLTLVNWSQARREERGEFLSLLLFAVTGLLLVGAADNLVLLFLALELVSIPTYIMVVLSRTSPRALESGTKYFYLGALSAAIMAYGFSFLYGISGTASLTGTAAAVTRALSQPGTLPAGLAMIGTVLAVGGLLFKLAAVPMHFYIADVYEGAASPVAGVLGFVPKLAGVVALFKIILLTGFWEAGGRGMFWLLWIVAVASMCIGNVLALRQTNIKRLLGYSGIAHAGYMLVGVLAGPLAGRAADGGFLGGVLGDGPAAVLYYVVVYGLANLAAFAVLGLLRTRGGPCETLRDAAGLMRREPGLALLLTLAMFTLMGLPPTPGFWGKLALFGSALSASRSAADSALVVLVVIAVLNSALAAAYYLRVVAAVLIYENDQPATVAPREALHIGALLCGFLILILAVYPAGLLDASTQATEELRSPADAYPLFLPGGDISRGVTPRASDVAALRGGLCTGRDVAAGLPLMAQAVKGLCAGAVAPICGTGL